MASFARYQLKAGVKPPPPPDGPPPPWMSKRPAGLTAYISRLRKGHLDLARLRSFKRPVYFASGGLSNPDYSAGWPSASARLSRLHARGLPDRHHFDPPHRVEPAKVAEDLRRLWLRADPQPALRNQTRAVSGNRAAAACQRSANHRQTLFSYSSARPYAIVAGRGWQLLRSLSMSALGACPPFAAPHIPAATPHHPDVERRGSPSPTPARRPVIRGMWERRECFCRRWRGRCDFARRHRRFSTVRNGRAGSRGGGGRGT